MHPSASAQIDELISPGLYKFPVFTFVSYE